MSTTRRILRLKLPYPSCRRFGWRATDQLQQCGTQRLRLVGRIGVNFGRTNPWKHTSFLTSLLLNATGSKSPSSADCPRRHQENISVLFASRHRNRACFGTRRHVLRNAAEFSPNRDLSRPEQSALRWTLNGSAIRFAGANLQPRKS